MSVVRSFFSERKMVFAYLAIWFAVIWAVLAISSQVDVSPFVSNTLYLSAFAAIHLGVIGQLYLLSEGQNPSLRNGFQLAQRHFVDWFLVIVFSNLYAIVVVLPLLLFSIISLIARLEILISILLGWLICPLFVSLLALLYEVGVRAVIFHGLPSNHAVKYAFKLVRENIKPSIKALLGYFAVLLLVVFLIELLFIIGFIPYMSDAGLTEALRLYTENQLLGFWFSIVTFFIIGIGLIFSTSLMNTFFVQTTKRTISMKSIE